MSVDDVPDYARLEERVAGVLAAIADWPDDIKARVRQSVTFDVEQLGVRLARRPASAFVVVNPVAEEVVEVGGKPGVRLVATDHQMDFPRRERPARAGVVSAAPARRRDGRG
ncbi:MAG: hypothetical protein IRY85_06970 [Micromonosporaceae bacterium]|nr:hypothetical protein [Micromonosporaceae bacterium]